MGSEEIYFAQLLGSNETEIRDEALVGVGKWFERVSSCENVLDEERLMKLWKGLFYYFWHCDKPLNQEEKTGVMSSYVHVFKSWEHSFMYFDTFLQTMAREWPTIDRFRIEKFMMLVRQMLNQTYELLKQLKWEVKWIKYFGKIVKKSVVNVSPARAPLGLKLHFADIYMEELAKVGSSEITPQILKKFLIPYFGILIKSDEPSLIRTVCKEVFLYLISQDIEDEDYQEFPILQFDANMIKELLMAKASDVRKRKNMKMIYNIVTQFEDYMTRPSADELPEQKPHFRGVKKKDVEKAVLSLMKDEEEFREEKLRYIEEKLANRKRKLNKLESDDLQEVGLDSDKDDEESDEAGGDLDPVPNKKGKKSKDLANVSKPKKFKQKPRNVRGLKKSSDSGKSKKTDNAKKFKLSNKIKKKQKKSRS